MKKLSETNTYNIRFLLGYLFFVCFVLVASYMASQIYKPHIALSLGFRIITWTVIPLVTGISLSKGSPLIRDHDFFFYIIILISSGIVLGVYTLLIFDSISKGYLTVIILPAAAVLTIVTVIGGKLICGWACPLGAFQEIVYLLQHKQSSSIPKLRVPFFIANSTRIVFFALGLYFAVFYSEDIITYDSPFGIFRPDNLSLIAILIILFMTLTSLFLYRPWCVFLCPFGLVSWLYEKIAVFRIKIDKDKCTECGKCVKVCPTTTMQAIQQEKPKLFTPDCWTCGRCVRACAKKSVYDKNQALFFILLINLS